MLLEKEKYFFHFIINLNIIFGDSTHFFENQPLCILSNFYFKKLITLLIGHSNNLIPSKSQKYAKIQLHDTLCVNGNLRFLNNSPNGYWKNSITSQLLLSFDNCEVGFLKKICWTTQVIDIIFFGCWSFQITSWESLVHLSVIIQL
jgi:hypothetical protein